MNFTKTASYFCLGIASLFLLGCSHSSAIYNPAINLPSKPLEAGDISVSSNYALAPEANPNNMESGTSPMAAASVRVGVTNSIGLQAEGWADMGNDRVFTRGGYAFSVLYNLNPNTESEYTWAIIPKYGFTLEEAVIESGLQVPGHGFSLSLATWKNTDNSTYRPYFGFSTIYGFSDWDHERRLNPDNEARIQNGIALALHGGINISLLSWLNLNAELPLVYQYNNFYDLHYLIPSPTVGLNIDLQLSKK